MPLWTKPGLIAPSKLLVAMAAPSRFSTLAPWLQALLEKQQDPPPKLYAWSPANITNDAPPSQSSQSSQLDGYPNKQSGRLYILGVGNLGRLFASCIRHHPQSPPITLVVHRKELLSEWTASNGIQIQRRGSIDASKAFDIEWWTETPPRDGPVLEVARGKTLQSLLVATKAQDAIPQVDRLRRYLDEGSTVAFLQNGMCKLWLPHGADFVARRFQTGREPNFLACVVNHGVFSDGPFRSTHASPADVAVGPVLLNGRKSFSASESASEVGVASSYLSDLLTTAPELNARAVPASELWVLQLQKVIVNCIINPLSAILRCRNGDVVKDPHGPVGQVIAKLLAEASSVLQALIDHESSAKILAQDVDGITAEEQTLASRREELRTRFSQPELLKLIYRVGELVKENTSSMLQDVRAGKKTEIREFNGWIVDNALLLNQGAKIGSDPCLDVSTHRLLIDLVEAQRAMGPSELASHLLGTSTHFV